MPSNRRNAAPRNLNRLPGTLEALKLRHLEDHPSGLRLMEIVADFEALHERVCRGEISREQAIPEGEALLRVYDQLADELLGVEVH